MELKQSLYNLYSATLVDPIPFEEFCETFHAKWKQAYQIGIVAPIDQLAQIDYYHEPTQDYGFGFGNGIKLAMAILLGKGDIELVKPVVGPSVEPENLGNLDKKTKVELIAIIKGS